MTKGSSVCVLTLKMPHVLAQHGGAHQKEAVSPAMHLGMSRRRHDVAHSPEHSGTAAGLKSSKSLPAKRALLERKEA